MPEKYTHCKIRGICLASMFGSTYVCALSFSKTNFLKNFFVPIQLKSTYFKPNRVLLSTKISNLPSPVVSYWVPISLLRIRRAFFLFLVSFLYLFQFSLLEFFITRIERIHFFLVSLLNNCSVSLFGSYFIAFLLDYRLLFLSFHSQLYIRCLSFRYTFDNLKFLRPSLYYLIY